MYKFLLFLFDEYCCTIYSLAWEGQCNRTRFLSPVLPYMGTSTVSHIRVLRYTVLLGHVHITCLMSHHLSCRSSNAYALPVSLKQISYQHLSAISLRSFSVCGHNINITNFAERQTLKSIQPNVQYQRRVVRGE